MAEDQNKTQEQLQQADQTNSEEKPRNQEPATAIKPASTEIKPAPESAKNSK